MGKMDPTFKKLAVLITNLQQLCYLNFGEEGMCIICNAVLLCMIHHLFFTHNKVKPKVFVFDFAAVFAITFVFAKR